MVLEVIAQVCKDYPHLDKLQLIAAEGVRVEFTQDVPPQSCPPDNHGSATERVNILRKDVRKEQDAGRCLILDLELLSMWLEVFISPFGIVDKTGGDPLTTGRTIHDLSFPEGASMNDSTDQDAIPGLTIATVMPLLPRFYGASRST
ncbi:Secreted protein [Phytophthora megakarya]|uniref:Secreted protein n=1 Tax=Phytophthora megakarya TaxID=4795 RepID=A0A225WCV6_9STRA|nr:Secreted protein [Phytophthora megakarya]